MSEFNKTSILNTKPSFTWPAWVHEPFEVRIKETRNFLNHWVKEVNHEGFIANDPISVPKQFSCLQDIEIMGLWTAVLSWGQRPVILVNAQKLIHWMGGEPYKFILHHKESDLKPFSGFVHRTFNGTDALYFIDFFKRYYAEKESLEDLFAGPINGLSDISLGLQAFHKAFFFPEWAPKRTTKHIPTPLSGSACKRLNMFLRWLVRNDLSGVDFGLWKKIKPSQLVCPLDIHSENTARQLQLLSEPKPNWKAALQLTKNLKLIDEEDPVKYDFALYGLGILMRHGKL